MKAVSEHLFRRGKRGNYYVRLRIPVGLRCAYPPKKTEVVRSLKTCDLHVAPSLMEAALADIRAEFEQKRSQLNLSGAWQTPRPVSRLTAEHLQLVSRFWVQQALAGDEARRSQGMTDDEFDELDAQLVEQRAALGRMLARGQPMELFPALRSFLHLSGIDFRPANDDEARRASYAFLQAVLDGIDGQLARNAGKRVQSEAGSPAAPHPLTALFPPRSAGPTWEAVFERWEKAVVDRPRSTIAASTTPWRDLRAFVALSGKTEASQVTPQDMSAWVNKLKMEGLAAKTVNERILKVRAIYKRAVSEHIGIPSNPAADTQGFSETGAKKRQKRRVSFDVSDIQNIFSSPVYTQHLRSKGQAGEATYWLPLMLYYSGARPEELAGLAIADVKFDPDTKRYYFDVADRYDEESAGDELELFDDEYASTVSRTLKNGASVRKVPVAAQLIELGLLRYIDWLREQKQVMLFPTLQKDWHGKLSGAFSKFFGRYKRETLGITDRRKVLYSLRHNMKDFMEAALVPSKYLKRILGHTTGDGAITDNYGGDLPFTQIASYFDRVQFPVIAAHPWEPGSGFVELKAYAVREVGDEEASEA